MKENTSNRQTDSVAEVELNSPPCIQATVCLLEKEPFMLLGASAQPCVFKHWRTVAGG